MAVEAHHPLGGVRLAEHVVITGSGPVAADVEVPAKAFEVVRFCNCLPLTIGMAGKLVHEIRRDGLMEGEQLEWGGVVELLEEEFGEGGHHRSTEEQIIRTSLRAIKGPHRKNVIRLFHALAVVPEDTRVPIPPPLWRDCSPLRVQP